MDMLSFLSAFYIFQQGIDSLDSHNAGDNSFTRLINIISLGKSLKKRYLKGKYIQYAIKYEN